MTNEIWAIAGIIGIGLIVDIVFFIYKSKQIKFYREKITRRRGFHHSL